MKKIVCFVLFIVAFQAFANDEVTGNVIAVIDGNTLEVLSADDETYKIVLTGVDSPELTQDYGEKAKKYLEKLLLRKTVVIQLKGKDRKGNYLAVVLRGKTDVRIALLKEGLAWTSEKDPLPELEAYRTNAKEKGKGLWKSENPTPPWIYRRQQSMMQPKSS